MNWRNYRNQILQVSSQFEAYIFFNENTDQGNNEDKCKFSRLSVYIKDVIYQT